MEGPPLSSNAPGGNGVQEPARTIRTFQQWVEEHSGASGAERLSTVTPAEAEKVAGHPTKRTLVMLRWASVAAKLTGLQVTISPGQAAGIASINTAGVTTNTLTFLVPPGSEWEWAQTGGTVPTTIEAYRWAF